ncbi:rhamnogalacturonan acetylesterase [Zunongwangia sp. SCSIO 43204]|uniref:rhamnogalacturonan acetylesterase n=1 Tax=Zunongwangia sp. SCSIO 43204 TaxID=2779359 RepID=UPI001CAA0FF7|nr:rhamnogalacturonan acetylesterase [Zunongwangia sp. SCSIO 43204]UAB82635.1 rhamnogalacturonan acetylesterase [Zunongwangia sp. SCSIO 43204]
MKSKLGCSLVLFLSATLGFAQSISFSKTRKADINLTENKTYSEDIGYGFDFNSGSQVKFENKGFVADTSVYFSVKLPEGNYKIDVVLGGKNVSETTIKAESRRLMLVQEKVDAHQTKTFSFNVHLHHQEIANTSEKVNLKPRELNVLDWDKKLTLEFLGNPAVQQITITPADDLTTIFLAGDSTVTNQDLEPWASWGQFLPLYVNQDAVVANYAASGASLSSFKTRKRFEKILSLLKKNDYLIIEFGHNDEKIKGEGNGAYGLYTKLLTEFIEAAREKGGIPILATPTQRRAFKDGKLQPTHGNFPDAMRKVAEEMKVPLIDITKATTKMYESWGDDISRKAFVQYPANTFPGQTEKLEDNTHFSNFGANEICLAFMQEIKEKNVSLQDCFKTDLAEYDPKKPNQLSSWTIPRSPRFESIKPYGN